MLLDLRFVLWIYYQICWNTFTMKTTFQMLHIQENCFGLGIYAVEFFSFPICFVPLFSIFNLRRFIVEVLHWTWRSNFSWYHFLSQKSIIFTVPLLISESCFFFFLQTSDTHEKMINMLGENHFDTQEFILSPLQFGVPYSRPRYFCLVHLSSSLSFSPHSPVYTTTHFFRPFYFVFLVYSLAFNPSLPYISRWVLSMWSSQMPAKLVLNTGYRILDSIMILPLLNVHPKKRKYTIYLFSFPSSYRVFKI